jgi:hypothetical protein
VHTGIPCCNGIRALVSATGADHAQSGHRLTWLGNGTGRVTATVALRLW